MAEDVQVVGVGMALRSRGAGLFQAVPVAEPAIASLTGYLGELRVPALLAAGPAVTDHEDDEEHDEEQAPSGEERLGVGGEGVAHEGRRTHEEDPHPLLG